MLSGEALAAESARARTLRTVRVSSREKGDLVMLGIGGFTPLEGFMSRADWEGVCNDYRTAAGLFWPIPITLSVDPETARAIDIGAEVALCDTAQDSAPLATMRVTEKYTIDKLHECKSVFRTADAEHPGVRMVMEQPEVNLAGPVRVLADGGFKARYGALSMTPAETRAEFQRLGWSRIAAFQTRNPMHRSHEYLVKVAIEVCDGLLVSGTKLRKWLSEGSPVPAEFSRPEVLEILRAYYASLDASENVKVKLAGHSAR